MEIDIAPYIKELLFKHNNLVIPGFGNFILTYASSTIDHVQGMLHPPSKSINFDANLITNDGKLQAFIQEKQQISVEDATAIINSYVSNLKSQLGKREMVVIPDVGKLYKDFENNIQFIADPTNFRKESFGLPTISFYPILKEKKSTQSIPPTTNKNVSSSKQTRSKQKKEPSFWNSIFTNSWLPYLLLGVLLVLGTCIIYPRLLTKNQSDSIENRVNQKPIKTDQEETEDPREDIVDMQLENELSQEEEQINTESITVTPDQKECIVSIGVFGLKENATKLIEKLFEKGYDAYTEKFEKNGKTYTKVGIQFGYETEQELNRTLSKIKKDYPNAVLIKQ